MIPGRLQQHINSLLAHLFETQFYHVQQDNDKKVDLFSNQATLMDEGSVHLTEGQQSLCQLLELTYGTPLCRCSR